MTTNEVTTPAMSTSPFWPKISISPTHRKNYDKRSATFSILCLNESLWFANSPPTTPLRLFPTPALPISNTSKPHTISFRSFNIGSIPTKRDVENLTQTFTRRHFRQQKPKRKVPSLSTTLLKILKLQPKRVGKPFISLQAPI